MSLNTSLLDNIIFAGTCLVLLLIPLPYGGVEEWAIFAFEAAVIILFGLDLASGKSRNAAAGAGGQSENVQVKTRGGGALLAAKIMLAFFFAVSVFQIIPLPSSWIGFLSPATRSLDMAAVRAGLGEIAGRRTMSLSLSPQAGLYEIVKLFCYALFGTLVFRRIRSRSRAKILVYVMMAAGVFEALYGLEELFGGTSRIFGWKNRYYAGSAFGTFVNRNHFSAFLEMILPLCLGYVLARADFFSMEKGLTLRQKILWFGQERLQKTIAVGVIPVIMGLGIVFSYSRSGVFVLIASILFMIALSSLAPNRHEEDIDGSGAPTSKRSRRLLRIIFLVVVGAALWIGIDPLIKRFSPDLITGEGRPILYKYTGDMIRANPVFGVGLGAYVYGYGLFEKKYTQGLTTHAHNDYLEVLAESGIPAGGMLIAAAFAVLAAMSALWVRRRDSSSRGVGLGCTAAIAAILIHSFTDYSLRMPANALYFVTLFALGLGVLSLRRPSVARPQAVPPPSISRGRKWRAVFTTFGVVFLLFITVKLNMGYLYLGCYESARAEAAQKGESLERKFPILEKHLLRAVRWWKNPIFFREMGRLYHEMAIAANDSEKPEARDAFAGRAGQSLTSQIERSPADAFAYYELGQTYMLINYPLLTYRDKALRYMRRALEVKPYDLFLNVNVLFNFLAQWDTLDKENKEFVFRTLRTAWTQEEKVFFPELVKKWKRAGGDLDGLKAILKSDPDVWNLASRHFAVVP